MTANLLSTVLYQPAAIGSLLRGKLPTLQTARLADWTVEQLDIKPYQHILELGYGQGRILQTVARKLKVGFLAGTDVSPAMYRRAYMRNRRSIEEQLVQLHFGEIADLPYPSHYFHTIYGCNTIAAWKDPQLEFIRLSNMLTGGGQLVMVFQPQWTREEKAVQQAAERIQEDMDQAGLTDIRIRYREMAPVTGIAVSGKRV